MIHQYKLEHRTLDWFMILSLTHSAVLVSKMLHGCLRLNWSNLSQIHVSVLMDNKYSSRHLVPNSTWWLYDRYNSCCTKHWIVSELKVNQLNLLKTLKSKTKQWWGGFIFSACVINQDINGRSHSGCPQLCNYPWHMLQSSCREMLLSSSPNHKMVY